jgi:hypothetical protein
VSRVLPIVVLVLVVAAAAVASTLLLRSAGGSDRVGDLSPVAPGLAGSPARPAPPATTTIRDDHHGEGGRDD